MRYLKIIRKLAKIFRVFTKFLWILSLVLSVAFAAFIGVLIFAKEGQLMILGADIYNLLLNSKSYNYALSNCCFSLFGTICLDILLIKFHSYLAKLCLVESLFDKEFRKETKNEALEQTFISLSFFVVEMLSYAFLTIFIQDIALFSMLPIIFIILGVTLIIIYLIYSYGYEIYIKGEKEEKEENKN